MTKINYRKDQIPIMNYECGTMAVPAVPGAGKTFIVTNLVAKLLEENKNEKGKILILTYMNSAANNFKGRIKKILEEKGIESTNGFEVMTIHSLAAKIIKEKPEAMMLSEDFNIADDFQKTMMLNDCINTFSQASAGYKRIKDIFDEKPDIIDKVVEKDGEHLTGDIELKNLTFQYPDGDTPVLKNVSVHIKPGEMLAVLGRTGSGKSTLADLLLRVYDCEKGMLLMDGRPIDEIPLHVLHRDVAYVPQENFMFSDTLEENIAFGLEDRIFDHPKLRDNIKEAAEAACIHSNIIDFPEGYQTLVGERGVTLSGGQKQRSSIARALLKNAPVLIMDDSLSAVDTDTEEQILENLIRLRKGKTTIIIAHRVSTLQKADHIAVLTEGELTEYGTHDELIREGGFYAKIYEKQQLEQELNEM